MYYTTIEQSKKLLELGLNPESADMYYLAVVYNSPKPITKYRLTVKNNSFSKDYDIPCWSVGALIDLLPDTINYQDVECDLEMGKHWLSYEGYDSYDSSYKVQPVVFKHGPLTTMLYKCVVWLLENNYIKTK